MVPFKLGKFGRMGVTEMVYTYPIFKTKVILPQEKPSILQRRQINKKLKLMTEYPVTLIHSGPGYGKSTALATFLKGHPNVCWYTITETDDDIVIFINYVIQSIRMVVPNFGEVVLKKLDGHGRSLWIQEICSEMVNAFTTLSQPLIIVLDDAHLVEHSDSISSLLQMLIENMPSNVHLVLSGRTRPEWPVMMKLKAKGNLLEISEKDFIFTYEEIDVLFHDFYQMPLENEQIKDILKITEGWVMAIQLIAHQSKEKGTLQKILENKNRSLHDLFQFLTMEVLSKLPKNLEAFLKQTSIFEELHPDMINQVLNITHAKSMIKKAMHANLFISSLDHGTYRYHSLFREFLISELSVHDPKQYEKLHRKAALYYEQQRKYDRAIYHYEMISDFHSAARILNHFGTQMIRFGSLESLKEKLQLLPIDVKNEYVRLWIFEGDVYRYRCQYGQALACYRKADEIASAKGCWQEQSSALEGIAQVFLDTIQPGRADEYLKKAVEVIPEDTADQCRRKRLSRLMAENLVNLGRAKEALAWLNIQMDDVVNVNNEKLEPRLLLRMGRLEEAIRLLEIQKLEEQKEENHLQQSHRETDLLLSLIHSFKGEAHKAKTLAQEGIMQGVKHKAPFVEACGWMRIGHAVQIGKQYDLSQAILCYETALKLMDDIQMPRGKAEPLMGLCGVYAQKGEFDTAIRFGDEALKETDKVSDQWLSALIRLSLSSVYFYMGNDTKSMALLHDCEKAFEACGDGYGLTVTYLWRAIIAFQREAWGDFEVDLKKCLKLAEEGHYDFLFERRTLLGPYDIQKITQMMLVAKQRGFTTPFIQRLMAKWKLSEGKHHPGYTLYVKTLGQFRIFLGQSEVSADAWSRSKSKELFQFLLTRRAKWVSREEMIACLWPGHSPSAGLSNFKVALNALNKVLEPHRKVRGVPFFIDRKDTMYRLNLTGIVLDVDDFEKTLHRAAEVKDIKEQTELLETGLAYYKGDFLPERQFEDWCNEERERIQLMFLRGSEKLAKLYISVNDFEKAIEVCERMIQVDGCWEEAYRIMMYGYYQLNNRPLAIKYFKKCSEKLDRELGIKPLPSTQALYQQILEGELPFENKI
jgi:DNA-binding SARP family transcriptional activator